MNKITITTNDLVSIEDARQILGISRVHIWRLMKKGLLQPLYFGNRPFFNRVQVEELKDERCDKDPANFHGTGQGNDSTVSPT